jgi:hypothetical protein
LAIQRYAKAATQGNADAIAALEGLAEEGNEAAAKVLEGISLLPQ